MCMIKGEKIGVGIVTCSRRRMFEKLINSLKPCNEIIDRLFVVQDIPKSHSTVKEHLDEYYVGPTIVDSWGRTTLSHAVVYAGENLGVAKAKNKCLRDLMDFGCDHIFLIEDDIFIKDPKVFEKYIEASKVSGIQHFNFSQHGRMNKLWPEGTPNPRYIIDYGTTKLPFYPHCVGAFSYYSRICLEFAGYMDERYYNAWEHVDHTYMIIKNQMHPPFWTFADIENSWEYLGDEEWSLENSLISSNPNHKQVMMDADKIFISKHGMVPCSIPLVSDELFKESLKLIQSR